jgi:hypothetical protein
MGAPRGKSRTLKSTEVNRTVRNKAMFEDVAAGMLLRDVAAKYDLDLGTVRVIIDQGLAEFSPEQDVETIRRMMVDQAARMQSKWLPDAMGETEVTVLAKQGEDQVPVTVPIPFSDQAKAADVVMKLWDRMIKWTGVEAELARRAAKAVAQPDESAELSDQALMEFIETVKAGMDRNK